MMTTPVSIPSAVARRRSPCGCFITDDMLSCRLLEVVLGRTGTGESVPDVHYALELSCADPTGYDVVITDHHMPMMGLELVARLRAMVSGKIIVFSSELSEAVDRGYRSHRVDHILPKPIFPSELRALFASL